MRHHTTTNPLIYLKAGMLMVPAIFAALLTPHVIAQRIDKKAEARKVMTAIETGAIAPGMASQAPALRWQTNGEMQGLARAAMRSELSNYETIDAIKHLPRGTTAQKHGYTIIGDDVRWSLMRDKGWRDK